MRLFWPLAGCVLALSTASSQQVAVTVQGLGAQKGFVYALSGEKTALVDSATSNAEGTFAFRLSERNAPGIFRLSFGKAGAIEFVNDGEDVELTSDARAPLDSLKVVRSESNRLYYAFRKLNRDYKSKREILQLVLARYPREDPFHHTTQLAAAELQEQYDSFVTDASRERPNSFIVRYIRSSRLAAVDLTQPIDAQLSHLKAHALDSVDFSDAGLIHSDLFASKSIEYLMYYRNPQLPKELLAKEFNRGVDSILNRAKVNQVVYRHITEYLVDGFKQFGFEECISYIVENYVIKDDLCLEESGNAIQRMIEQKKQLKVGVVAPDIALPDTAGTLVSLRDLRAEKTLIIFYSTTCPHCQSMVPEVFSLAGTLSPTLVVMAVSLDTNPNDWLNYVRTNRLAWTNVVDLQGWGGKSATDYFIYATPTMVLLDREQRIIGKPMTVAELQKLL